MPGGERRLTPDCERHLGIETVGLRHRPHPVGQTSHRVDLPL